MKLLSVEKVSVASLKTSEQVLKEVTAHNDSYANSHGSHSSHSSKP